MKRGYHKILSKVKVRVKFTLRLAVYRQSLSLGFKHIETHDQRFFFSNCNFAVLFYINVSINIFQARRRWKDCFSNRCISLWDFRWVDINASSYNGDYIVIKCSTSIEVYISFVTPT
jgi:hypothetical protein